MTLRVGRYETLRPIAAGGMATVYLGRALGAGGFERLVAIKVMHPHIADEPEFVAMFLDEARLAARIRHPNVVATIDVQQSDDGLFLVMEYVEGPSLQTILKDLRKRQAFLPLGVVLRIFLDLLAGLHAAHELIGPEGATLNLVHRDVSPQNVLIGTDGITRITDFGVARAESRLSSTRGGQLKGKIAYMAPEQIRAETIDRRCDVYAAGAVLWEMLVGQRLFRAENDGALVAKILSGVVQSPRDFNPTVPPQIERVCLQALHPDPSVRFASAGDLAEAAEDAAFHAGVKIATSRAVATYVRELGIDLSKGEAGAKEKPGSQPSRPAAGAPAVKPTATTPPPKSDEVGTQSASGVGPPSVSTHVASVLTSPPPPRPSRRGLVAGAAALGACALIVGLVSYSMSAGEPGGEPASAADQAATNAPAAATPPPRPATPPPQPERTPTATSATAKAAATTPPVAATPNATSKSAAAAPAEPKPKPAKPTKPSSPGSASPGGTSFRPSEL